ncbi:MAG: DUF4397 domain-containing protein [Gemmatimonadetes bacterium]|nr:DUF4397 domain-containing protein [Gemmatimonadota bacterium]
MHVAHTLRPRQLGQLTRLRRMRRLPRLVPIVLLSLAAACDDSDGPERVAQVRFLHASPGRAAIDFRADGTTRGAAQAYGANWSNSVVLDAGARTFTARLTGATTDLASTGRTLANNGAYSLVLAKRPTTDSLVIFADTSATPAADKAIVRILNVAPAAGMSMCMSPLPTPTSPPPPRKSPRSSSSRRRATSRSPRERSACASRPPGPRRSSSTSTPSTSPAAACAASPCSRPPRAGHRCSR